MYSDYSFGICIEQYTGQVHWTESSSGLIFHPNTLLFAMLSEEDVMSMEINIDIDI